ncbi:MAG: phosphoribosylglycinamide formyltransferase [Mangrovibacterium sp.]
MNKKKIAVFASGSGTNARCIMEYFSQNTLVKVDSVFTNNSKAGVIVHAEAWQVPCFTFSKADFYENGKVFHELESRSVDLIVLAGFLWLLPPTFIAHFKIVNIHPSLLPKYGGKGMYGLRVHQAVIANREQETGITIHLVDEVYDSGTVLLQECIPVLASDSPESLQQRVHALEYKHYPPTIARLLLE